MRLITDFHLHSKYSRATSKDLIPSKIASWSKFKGIDLVGTGDFTHPFWLATLKQEFEPVGNGFYRLKKGEQSVQFMLSVEISNIYSQGGRVRKIHTVVVAPSIETVEKINERLSRLGNLYADGRPIFGFSCKELAKVILGVDTSCLLIPAHIWTPWFSLFGSNSGFDTVEECFGQYTKDIVAVETGLSSDPEMNWRLSMLDRFSIVSCSDAHSPKNLGREATVFEMDEPSYEGLGRALRRQGPEKLVETIEFFPEEGKYHFDGHRNCDVRLHPKESKEKQKICPACGKPLTIGVLHRVEELADREEGFKPTDRPSFRKIVPLELIIAEVLGQNPGTKAVEQEYHRMIQTIGSEFSILLDVPEEQLRSGAHPKVADGILKTRGGDIYVEPGFDGVYGVVKLFRPGEDMQTQASLF